MAPAIEPGRFAEAVRPLTPDERSALWADCAFFGVVVPTFTGASCVTTRSRRQTRLAHQLRSQPLVRTSLHPPRRPHRRPDRKGDLVASMNNCSFTGRLGRDPETRDVGDTSVTSFSLAVDGFKKDSETLWLDVSAWGKMGENVARYCSKGSEVAVSGRVGLRTYDKKDGTTGASVTLDARDVTFIGGRVEQESAPAEEPAPVEAAADEDFGF